MRNKHQCKRYDIRKHHTLIDQFIYTYTYERKQDKRIEPHRIHKLNDHIAHKCIDSREDYQRKSFRLFERDLFKEESERNCGCTYLCKLNDHYRYRHHRSWQQIDYQHIRACKVICKDTEHLTAEVS